MGELIFVILSINSIIFSFIFWILTWVFRFFYYNKQKKRKLEFYECGFVSSIGLRIQVTLAYCLILLFFILYDLEFLAFFVYSFFNATPLITVWGAFLTFFILLLFCLLVDYSFNLLDFIVK